jgi:photosystem II stability/assembly factor-like uncharacterized protein
MAGSFGFFAASDSGLFHKEALDSPWTKVTLDSAGTIGFVATQGPHVFAIGTSVHDNDRCFLSHDGGVTWKKIDVPWTTASRLFASDSAFFCYRYSGIWVSRDHGEHWDEVHLVHLEANSSSNISATVVDGNAMILGGSGFYFITLDAGRNWFNLPQRNLNEASPASVLPVGKTLWADSKTWDPATKDWHGHGMPAGNLISFAKHGERIFAATDAGLFLSDNAGQTWIKAGINPDIPGLSDARQFQFRNDTGFALLNGRMHFSADQGATWMETGEGPPGSIKGIGIVDGSSSSGAPFDTLSGQGPMGDFCPLGMGNTWTYSRYQYSEFHYDNRREASIRTVQVDSGSPEQTGKRYHVIVKDSVLWDSTYTVVRYGDTIPGQNRSGGHQGTVRWLGAVVHEGADGELSAEWKDSTWGVERTTAGTSAFLQHAFKSHRYGGFAISDTTPDHSRPQWAKEWYNGTPSYLVRIDRDLGLSAYSEKYHDGYSIETVRYDLLSFQKEAPLGIVPHPGRSRFRPRLGFDGHSLLIDGRRFDGRRAARAPVPQH